jgi:hypothetical protein
MADAVEFTADQLLGELTDAGANPPCSLLCTVELTRFDPSQRQALLPLLWQYIFDRRNSNDRDDLVAVGAAIRKYVAIMPMDRMGELAVVLETGSRSPLPIDLEIEVAKMVYRNFEVHPPVVADPHPELAQRLWEMVQAYVNPRVLLRDKHSAATSLAIEAIVSMRVQPHFAVTVIGSLQARPERREMHCWKRCVSGMLSSGGRFPVARRRRRWETYAWTRRMHRRSFLRKKWPGDFMAN